MNAARKRNAGVKEIPASTYSCIFTYRYLHLSAEYRRKTSVTHMSKINCQEMFHLLDTGRAANKSTGAGTFKVLATLMSLSLFGRE